MHDHGFASLTELQLTPTMFIQVLSNGLGLMFTPKEFWSTACPHVDIYKTYLYHVVLKRMPVQQTHTSQP